MQGPLIRASCPDEGKLDSKIRNKSLVERVWSDMTIEQTDDLTRRKPLRLWPGVVAVALQWLLWFVFPLVVSRRRHVCGCSADSPAGWSSSCGGCSSAGRPGPSAWAPSS